MNGRARRRRWLGPLLLAALVFGCELDADSGGRDLPELRLREDDRILVLAPHPDDEVLGAAGVLQRAAARGLPVRVVFLTYGDSNQWSFLVYRKRPTLTARQARAMGDLRRREALAAADRLGVPRESVTFLGYPDHGMLRIFVTAWRDRRPVRGPLTRAVAVPYPTARRPGAAHRGEEVLRDLVELIRDFRPTRVFVSHPADHHPDHAALYLFTRVALWELALSDRVALHPYLVHFPRWSLATGARPERPLLPPADLYRQAGWHAFPLSDGELEGKRRALEAHATQFGYSARRLLRFVRANELFGDFPALYPGPSGIELVDDETGPEEAIEAPEALAEDLLEEFVDLERLEIREGRRALELTVHLDRALEPGQALSIFLLGQRDDRPFAELPKIEVRIGAVQVQTLERGRRLAGSPVTVVRRGRRLGVTVPRELLGSPRRVLLSGRSAYGSAPLDRLPWYVVDFGPEPATAVPPL